MIIKLIEKRIKAARKKSNMTQENLSELVNVTLEHISRLETGAANIGPEMIVKIAENLSIEPESLLLGATSTSKIYLNAELSEYMKDCPPDKINAIVQIAKMISELK